MHLTITSDQTVPNSGIQHADPARPFGSRRSLCLSPNQKRVLAEFGLQEPRVVSKVLVSWLAQRGSLSSASCRQLLPDLTLLCRSFSDCGANPKHLLDTLQVRGSRNSCDGVQSLKPVFCLTMSRLSHACMHACASMRRATRLIAS